MEPLHLPPGSVAEQAAQYAQIMATAFVLANDRALTDIRSHARRVELDAPPCPGEWYDVRPLLHTHDGGDGLLQLALRYARQAGLVYQHPVHGHLACIVSA